MFWYGRENPAVMGCPDHDQGWSSETALGSDLYTLGPVLIVYPRTQAPRVSRYDRLATLVQSAMAKAGWYCVREPAILTEVGLQRPDLVFHHPDRPTYLLGVAVVFSNVVLRDAHMRKV